MIYFIAYLVGFFVTWVVAAKMFVAHEEEQFGPRGTDAKVFAVGMGMITGLLWPVALLCVGVYKFVFGTKRGRDDE